MGPLFIYPCAIAFVDSQLSYFFQHCSFDTSTSFSRFGQHWLYFCSVSRNLPSAKHADINAFSFCILSKACLSHCAAHRLRGSRPPRPSIQRSSWRWESSCASHTTRLASPSPHCAIGSRPFPLVGRLHRVRSSPSRAPGRPSRSG